MELSLPIASQYSTALLLIRRSSKQKESYKKKKKINLINTQLCALSISSPSFAPFFLLIYQLILHFYCNNNNNSEKRQRLSQSKKKKEKKLSKNSIHSLLTIIRVVVSCLTSNFLQFIFLHIYKLSEQFFILSR